MKPIVAVVGRPNVGKSTLFNRLVGRREAIVHDSPGVTRDRNYADAHIQGRDLVLIDTGGYDTATDDPMGLGIARQVRAAIDEADVVVCVLDGSAPPTPQDQEAVRLLRRSKKPVLFAANKMDRRGQAIDADLHRLGIDPVFAISALHGRSTGDLEAALVRGLGAPDAGGASQTSEGVPRIAIVGKPNAGKSSLFNHLVGSERSLVDHRPGTTRDPIDAAIVYRGTPMVVVDTAGIRRKARVKDALETASVIRALRSLERADVAVLLFDAEAGPSEQDQRLAALALERSRALVVGLNKWDLVSKRDAKQRLEAAAESLRFVRWAKFVPVSAKTGAHVPDLVRAATRAAKEMHRRIPTGELNRFFEEVIARQPPPTSGGKAPRLYYVAQVGTAPPLFAVVCSSPEAVRESYRRFLENQIRARFGFDGAPVVLRLRAKRRK